MRVTTLAVFALLACVASLATFAEDNADWPAWRGPLATGVAPSADPPIDWSATKNMRWTADIPGRGNASPIIWGERAYVLTAIATDKTADAGFAPRDKSANAGTAPHDLAGASADSRSVPPETARASADAARGDAAAIVAFAQEPPPPDRPGRGNRPPRGDGPPRGAGRPQGPPGGQKSDKVHQFAVIALDRKSGKVAWQTVVRECVPHAGTHGDGSLASASPVTDGKHIFAFFGSYGLYCLDLSGRVVWEKDLGDMHTRNDFGEGASPALHGDTLIVNWDHEKDDFIAAFDKQTGKELWRRERDEATSWTTPLIVAVGDKAQVIVPGTKSCLAYDLADGKTIWECGGLTTNVIPTAVAADGVVYLTSGFRGTALKAIRLSDAHGKVDDTKAVLFSTEGEKTPYVSSPLLVDGCLYFLDNNRPVLTCLNARDGSRHYGPQRLEGIAQIYASPVAARERIYIAGRDGEVIVVRQGPKFEQLATNKLEDDFEASPALAGKELYLRGRGKLYCIAGE